jgi:hypothetical protein
VLHSTSILGAGFGAGGVGVGCLEAEHSVEVPPFLPLHFHFQLVASSDIS